MGVELGRSCILSKTREIPAGFEEILVPRRPLLAVPPLLIGDNDRRKNREFLDCQGNMRQIGNRTVPVLKIKRVKKLLGLLESDLSERFLHRKR